LQSRDKSSGIAFESEQEILDTAYKAKQTASAVAASAAAALNPAEDEMPPLQTVAETAVPMTLDEQAAAALLEDSHAGVDVASASLPSAAQADAYARAAPILIANALPGNSQHLSEEERIALDVEQRPDEASLDDYERVPVEEFGAGMLRGMGWKGLGDPIGGIVKANVEPVTFAPRGERMGLGASFAKVKDNRGQKKYIKPGETRDPVGVVRQGGSAASAAGAANNPVDLKAQSLRSLGSRLIQVQSQQLRVGALVEIMEGPHRGSYGRVQKHGDTSATANVDDVMCSIKLQLSEAVVDLPRGSLEILDERAMPEDHPAFEDAAARARRIAKEKAATEALRGGSRATSREERKEEPSVSGSKRERERRRDYEDREDEGSSSKRARNNNDRDRNRDRDRDRERDRGRERSHRSRSRSRSRDHNDRASSSRHSSSSHSYSSAGVSSSAAASSSGGPPRWVRPHIRVRIVSSSYAGGAWYNRKATVVDVSSSANILVRPDDEDGRGGGGRLLDGLAERQLESVLPAAGAGRVMLLRGEHKGEVGKLLQKQADKQKAVVQLDEDLNLVTVDYDDIAEYVG
jgi:ribosomal protein L24